MHNLNHGNNSPKNGLLLYFLKNFTKQTITPCAKIRPIWSPWRVAHLAAFQHFTNDPSLATLKDILKVLSEHRVSGQFRFTRAPSVRAVSTSLQRLTWGRCYEHNFLRFLPIFGEKIGFFLKKKQILQTLAVV
jgi:hypothetical protein